MSHMEYILEIYEPESADNVWAMFSSESPFMTISPGDILDPGVWEGSKPPIRLLRIVNVEHLIWDMEGVKHKILVFTKEVEGTREIRLRR